MSADHILTQHNPQQKIIHEFLTSPEFSPSALAESLVELLTICRMTDADSLWWAADFIDRIYVLSCELHGRIPLDDGWICNPGPDRPSAPPAEAPELVKQFHNHLTELQKATNRLLETLDRSPHHRPDPARLAGQFENLSVLAGSFYRRKRRKLDRLAEALGADELADFWREKLAQEDQEKAGSKLVGYYGKQKLIAFTRDNFRCKWPGCHDTRLGRLTAHHIIERNEGGSDSADNLITYCVTHHRLAHAAGGAE